jgi:ribonuclease HI
MPFYAVAKGRNPGVYTSWPECKQQVHKYLFAKYRKFDTEQEALDFVSQYSGKHNDATSSASSASSSSSSPKSVPKKKKDTTHTLLIPHEKTDLFVYTDGACSKNGSARAKAGIGIYFGEGNKHNTSKMLINTKQTNNVAELSALKRAIAIVLNDETLKNGKTTFVTDSKYSIQCLTTYGDKCAKSGWKTDIPNKELVMETYKVYNDNVSNVRLLHVMAHTSNSDIHSIGNHYADMLAVKAIT